MIIDSCCSDRMELSPIMTKISQIIDEKCHRFRAGMRARRDGGRPAAAVGSQIKLDPLIPPS